MTAARVEYGDWQTPPDLARACVDVLARALRAPPAAVVEPTCGVGAFLVAARERFGEALLRGYEINPAYAARAREAVAGAEVTVADFFSTDWHHELSRLPEPLLVVGNPPWVTSASLGALGSRNLPAKTNYKALRGLDAVTGRANFDVSEWMLTRLVDALDGRGAVVAVLCKQAVARRVVEHAWSRGRALTAHGLWRVDASKHFGAAVGACLFVFETRAGERVAPVYASLDARDPAARMGLVDGALVADLAAWEATRHLAGRSEPEWRSGIKHDCAAVMELTARDGRWRNGRGDEVVIEAERRYPLLKGTDVALGRTSPRRAVIVTQRRPGEDTLALAKTAPATWAYLTAHRGPLDARRSSIYRAQPPFAVFGVGPYSFAPWKVAVSGLHKRLAFTLVGPHEGAPVLFDDTCYFLPFEREGDARAAQRALASPEARAFFEARVFWDAKRPVHKALLQSLDLARLVTR